MRNIDVNSTLAYFRVSTLNQSEDYYSEDYYREQFQKLGFPKERIFYDIDSGANNMRKDYRIVMEKIRKGEAICVCVPDFSRFTRSPEGWEEAIKDFQFAGASLVSLDGSHFSLDSPENIYTSRMLVANAAYVREQNQYKSLRGYKFGREEGRAFQHIFPYVLTNGKLVPNKDLYKDSGKTYWEVAVDCCETFVKCRGNISQTIRTLISKYGGKQEGVKPHLEFPNDCAGFTKWISNEALRGNLKYFEKVRAKYRDRKYNQKPITVQGTHEALILPEDWRRIEPLLNSGAGRKPYKISNPLQGLMFCSGCGARMRTQGGRGQNVKYYVCSSAYPETTTKRMRQEQGLEERCDRRSSYGLKLRENVEPFVISELCKRADKIAKEAEGFEGKQGVDQNNPLMQQIRKKEKEIDNLVSLGDEDVLPAIDKKRREVKGLYDQIPSIEQVSERRQKLAKYGKNHSFWSELEPKERMILYREFIRRIECDKGVMQISWKDGLEV